MGCASTRGWRSNRLVLQLCTCLYLIIRDDRFCELVEARGICFYSQMFLLCLCFSFTDFWTAFGFLMLISFVPYLLFFFRCYSSSVRCWAVRHAFCTVIHRYKQQQICECVSTSCSWECASSKADSCKETTWARSAECLFAARWNRPTSVRQPTRRSGTSPSSSRLTSPLPRSSMTSSCLRFGIIRQWRFVILFSSRPVRLSTIGLQLSIGWWQRSFTQILDVFVVRHNGKVIVRSFWSRLYLDACYAVVCFAVFGSSSTSLVLACMSISAH